MNILRAVPAFLHRVCASCWIQASIPVQSTGAEMLETVSEQMHGSCRCEGNHRYVEARSCCMSSRHHQTTTPTENQLASCQGALRWAPPTPFSDSVMKCRMSCFYLLSRSPHASNPLSLDHACLSLHATLRMNTGAPVECPWRPQKSVHSHRLSSAAR